MKHHRSLPLLTALVLTGVLVGPVGPAAAADTQAPVVRSLTTSATTIDTTRGPGAVTVSVRVSDAGGAGVEDVRIDGVYTRDTSAHPASPSVSRISDNPVDGFGGTIFLHRVSGTATDGVYRNTVFLTAGTRGTWALEVSAFDADGNATGLSSTGLAAIGATSSLRSTTTAVPAAPKLKGSTQTAFNLEFGIFGFFGYVTWTAPSGTPVSNGYVLEQAGQACGREKTAFPVNGVHTSISFDHRVPPLPCTVKLRVVNAAGVSPAASLTFI